MTGVSLNQTLITVLGHTAGGKTAFAARLAHLIDAEVISADSRQVYRGMDLGTGKDLGDYIIDGQSVRYHLIDVAEAGEQYSLFQFQKDVEIAISDIRSRAKLPLLCGGSGLYLESVLRNYRLVEVAPDMELRARLNEKSDEELTALLKSFGPIHNTTDTDHRKRLIRAVEIATAGKGRGQYPDKEPERKSIIIGIRYEVAERRRRITERLRQRLNEGMIEEVSRLLIRVSPENLIYYGLEYKYITEYLMGEYGYEEMFSRLNTAIHQFAKRQMTWFRGMERRGLEIHWLEGEEPEKVKIEKTLRHLKFEGLVP
jgi:tRNA dimethylallyltransferase